MDPRGRAVESIGETVVRKHPDGLLDGKAERWPLVFAGKGNRRTVVGVRVVFKLRENARGGR